MRSWTKPVAPDVDEVFEFQPPVVIVEMSENPVVAELLGPDGRPIRQWVEREPIGFRLR